MQIKDQWIVNVNGAWHILYFCAPDKYFITSNGGFGQRDLYIEEITKEEAWKIQSQTI